MKSRVLEQFKLCLTTALDTIYLHQSCTHVSILNQLNFLSFSHSVTNHKLIIDIFTWFSCFIFCVCVSFLSNFLTSILCCGNFTYFSMSALNANKQTRKNMQTCKPCLCKILQICVNFFILPAISFVKARKIYPI